MQTKYTVPIQKPFDQMYIHGFVTFEQSNREHDQITVEERHARLVTLSTWRTESNLRCSSQLIP